MAKKKKQWLVTLLRRETVDSSLEVTVEGATQEEAEQNALTMANSGKLPAKPWHVEGSETESIEVDSDQTEEAW